MKSTQAMRDRCRELSNGGRDDYDRSADATQLLRDLSGWRF